MTPTSDLHLRLSLTDAAVTFEDAAVTFQLLPFDAAPPGLHPFLPHPALAALTALDPRHLLAGLQGAVTAVCAEGAGARVAAIRLSTPGRSLVAVGRENVLLTPALLDLADGPSELPPPPQLLPPDLRPQVSRYATIGSLIIRWLTREWIDLQGRAPLGLPLDPLTQDYPRDPDRFRALGVRLAACPLLAPPHAVLAQLTPEVAARLAIPPFTPLLGPP